MKGIALYDRTCSLCRESKEIFEKLDWFRKVKWVPLQEYKQTEHTVMVDLKALKKEIHVITSQGKVLTGYNAIRYLLLLFPATFLIAVILFIPFSSVIGNPIYRLIARNRHKFLKRRCQDGNCRL